MPENSTFTTENPERCLSLQWHITARCPNRCSHCYMQDSEGYKSEIENELSGEECLKVIDDFHRLTQMLSVEGTINFTGGDPLLKPEIFELIKYACQRNITVGILGNGEYLTPETVSRLKMSGVSYYQVSIDGMEKTHDKIRGRGSFKQTLKGIRILREMGLSSMVMFTVTRENMDELIPVLDLVARERVSGFDFSRLVPIGSGAQFRDDLIEAEEYRCLLLSFLERYRQLVANGCGTYFGRKDHLWKLLYQELGLFSPSEQKGRNLFEEYQIEGCQIGKFLIVVVADGTVYPCRRLPVKIGKVPNESLGDIFMNAPELNRMREIERMEKCSKCELLQFCRGCPAVAYAVSGSYFAPDPQCWKQLIFRKEEERDD